jgi:uncharacterized protein (TIGR04255 family)
MNRQYVHMQLPEAVCEFRFQPDSHWDAAIPGLVYAALRQEYPKRVYAQTGLTATLAVGPQGAQQEVQSIHSTDDLRFWRESDDGVIRVRPHTLAVSHYKPYPSWEGFRPEIMEVLRTYRQVANPTGLQRVGLRLINEFDFDDASGNTSIDPDQFFELGPRVGERMRQDIATFFVGIQYLFDEERDSLRIQMQPAPPERPGAIRITLDLDYFLNQPGQVALDDVEEWIETAHERIGVAFESCLKEPLREQLQDAGA